MSLAGKGNSVAGKAVIVTGGGGGLGKAIALRLLAGGARVLVCDVHEHRIEEFVKEHAALTSSDQLVVCKADVTQEAQVEELFRTAIAKLGKVDVLVNNAGMVDRMDPVGDLDKALWDRVLALNLTGPYLTSKTAVNHMLSQSPAKGSIINIGSASCTAGLLAGAAYTASKHGLLGMTKNTAAAYGKKGIRCNIIMPGGMHTNITDNLAQGINMSVVTRVQPRSEAAGLCNVDEVAAVVQFLASDDSAVVNGAAIHSDNGWLAE